MGAERYKAAYEHILGSKSVFDVDRALETLEKAVSTREWPTLCSMVFDPDNGDVFIALNWDFDRVWKVSMKDQTMEGYRGVRKGKKMPLGSSGVEASELEKMAVSRAMPRGHILGLVVILAE